MRVSQLIKKDTIFIEDSFADTDELYQYFSENLKKQNVVNEGQIIKRLFIKRENIQSTAIGKGVATPHIFSESFEDFFISMGLVRKGMPYKAPDKGNVFIVFLIMSNDKYVSYHLKSLAAIAKLTGKEDFVDNLVSSKTPDELFENFEKFEQKYS